MISLVESPQQLCIVSRPDACTLAYPRRPPEAAEVLPAFTGYDSVYDVCAGLNHEDKPGPRGINNASNIASLKKARSNFIFRIVTHFSLICSMFNDEASQGLIFTLLRNQEQPR